MSNIAVILPAAGRSSRFGTKEKKPFALLEGRAVVLRTLELFVTRPNVVQTLLVISPEDDEFVRRRLGPNLAFLNVQLVPGGAERFESVANALAQLRTDIDFVAIHDAVRPCVTTEQLDRVFQKAEETGSAMLAVPVVDTVKRVGKEHQVVETLPRSGLWLAQTPQIFRKELLLTAYAQRGRLGRDITDDAQLVEALGETVHVVEGSAGNLKITTQSDLYLAEALLKSLPKPKAKTPIHPFADEEMWGGRGK